MNSIDDRERAIEAMLFASDEPLDPRQVAARLGGDWNIGDVRGFIQAIAARHAGSGIAHVPIFIRLARGSTLVVRQLDYVSQARTFGAGTVHILFRHILPNISGPLIIMATLSIAGAVREEASLSFLGLGVQPPYPSWGNLIRDGVANVLTAPLLAVLPGAALTLAVLAFNLIGDALRDMLDPRDLTAGTRGAAGRPMR